MVTNQEIELWLESKTYTNLLSSVETELGLRINHGEVPEILLGYDAKKIEVANALIDDLERVAIDKVLCVKFVSKKLDKMMGVNQEQEGQLAEKNDSPSKVLPFYRSFLNIYLIELYFLTKNPAGLEEYLKKIRIPFSKKYAKVLRFIFHEMSS